MIEALWSVEFLSNVGFHGMGVAVIESGRLLGGDSAFLYTGNIRVENSTVLADLKIKKYNHTTQIQSVFGPLKEFNLKLSGPVNSTNIMFSGHVVEQPNLHIHIHAVRRAELP